MGRRRVHYVLSSHLDREVWVSFQSMRFNLVQLMDHMLAGLADGRLKGPDVSTYHYNDRGLP